MLIDLVHIPNLVVRAEASYHALYDYCTVGYLREARVSVDFLDLPKAGIHGNAHFFFLEMDSLEIAARIEEWISGKLA